jgi:hypothetical protein
MGSPSQVRTLLVTEQSFWPSNTLYWKRAQAKLKSEWELWVKAVDRAYLTKLPKSSVTFCARLLSCVFPQAYSRTVLTYYSLTHCLDIVYERCPTGTLFITRSLTAYLDMFVERRAPGLLSFIGHSLTSWILFMKGVPLGLLNLFTSSQYIVFQIKPRRPPHTFICCRQRLRQLAPCGSIELRASFPHSYYHANVLEEAVSVRFIWLECPASRR